MSKVSLDLIAKGDVTLSSHSDNLVNVIIDEADTDEILGQLYDDDIKKWAMENLGLVEDEN